MPKSRLLMAAGGLAAAVLLLVPQPAAANDEYYKGKTVRFVVGFGAGGGYDAYARMLAPHFAERLGATVLVENQPGAGGMSSLNRFAHAPGDGLQLTIVNGAGAAVQQLLDVQGVRFDLTELAHLGIIDHARWLLLVQPKSPHNTLEDMLKSGDRITFGGSGRVDTLIVGAAMACHAIELNCHMVPGYAGSAAVALALAQGEMDALYVSETSAYDFVQAKNARAITTWNRERSILFPDLPSVFEQMNLTEEQAWWVDTRNTIEGLGRMLAAPPATPKARLDTLRKVAKDILTDEKIVAEADRRKRFIKFIDAETSEQMARRLLAEMTPEQKAEVRKVILGE